jgi:hypothetical protein
MRVASEAVSAERNDIRRNARSSRLHREVALTERAEVAEPREHGQTVPGDEDVDRDDRHDDDRGGAQGSRKPATDAGTVPRAKHGQRQGE